LVEVILAIALFSLFAVALIGLIVASYGSNYQAAERDRAAAYAQEGLDAVSSIRRQAWNLLVDGDHGLSQASGYWEFSGQSDFLADGKYTRIITVSPACRDGFGVIVSCSDSGATTDLNTKKVVSKVSYTAITLMAINIELTSYLTTWQTKDWVQTDWSGGAGQTIWSDATRYNSDDGNINYSILGEVKLVGSAGGGCGVNIWPFDTPSDYTYDPDKIEVTGAVAQLKPGPGTPIIDQTVNPNFSTALTPWTFGSWGTATPTGSRSSSGGNPGAYARIIFPSTKNKVAGGYFEQAFTVSAQTVLSATLNFDWNISLHTRAADNLTLYAFVDTVPGQPTVGQEVWTSGNQTALQPWTSVSSIDVLNKITGPGTYYLKIVAYVDYPNGSPSAGYIIGFDNVNLNWSSGAAGYPTDRPSINPTAPYHVTGIEQWSSFTETATKNGGEIYYQLSEDGVNWRYWDGMAWVDAGIGQYNTAAIVNANIAAFPISASQISFRAFLSGNGIQQVKLDQVRIGWGEPGSSGYTLSGWFESSAFDTGGVSAFNFISWSESLPSASDDIKVQIATAPTAAGPWDWYGLTGAGTYYQSGDQTLIPLANNHNDNRWIKYRAELSGDGLSTPILQEMKINYTP